MARMLVVLWLDRRTSSEDLAVVPLRRRKQQNSKAHAAQSLHQGDLIYRRRTATERSSHNHDRAYCCSCNQDPEDETQHRGATESQCALARTRFGSLLELLGTHLHISLSCSAVNSTRWEGAGGSQADHRPDSASQ